MLNDNATLYQLLDDTWVPEGYRWQLKQEEGLLVLRIQHSDRYPMTIFGKTITWKPPFQTVRELRSPTYGGLLQQLREWPEFLEMYRASDKPLRQAAVTS